MHEVLVNRLGGLSLPRKSVVRLTDRPDMTLDVYSGRKTTMHHLTFISWSCDFALYLEDYLKPSHNLKIKVYHIVIKNVIGSEDTLMHKAEHPSNYFFQHFHTKSG